MFGYIIFIRSQGGVNETRVFKCYPSCHCLSETVKAKIMQRFEHYPKATQSHVCLHVVQHVCVGGGY